MVEQLGGTISLRANKGMALNLVFIIPVKITDHENSEVISLDMDILPKIKRVLIIDDEPICRRFF